MSRKVSQQELRKVMNNAKKKLAVEKKKIESPLAKYNAAGQLTCVICKCNVDNEAVWPVHLNSRRHKESIDKAKQQLEKGKSIISGQKRPTSSFEEPQPAKKIKSILKNSQHTSQIQQTKSQLPDDFFDKKPATLVNIIPKQLSNGIEIKPLANGNASFAKSLTSDKSVEISIKPEEDKEEEKQQTGKENSAVLPEGFFDDPIQDAKARNVEYRDPQEEEWEKFLKEIKEEEAQANQIIADDQEEATTERQMHVIDEQYQRLLKVMDLVGLKEKMKQAERKNGNTGNESSSSDDEDFDEFLDWRAKKSYK